MALTTFRAFQKEHTDLAVRPTINFLHPGYMATDGNILLQLPRVDKAPSGQFGVHHRTALVGCQIIANNQFEAYFTATANSDLRIPEGPDDVLLGEKYYLHVPNADQPYPIVPSFQEWVFPHGKIPAAWPVVTSRRQEFCSITNFRDPLDQNHLVPKAEQQWYQANGMSMYSEDGHLLNNAAPNQLHLTPSLHKVMDSRGLVIVPKLAGGQTSAQYVTHILKGSKSDYWPEYHNIPVMHLHESSLPYIFARFAWAILFSTKTLIVTGRGIRNVVKMVDKGDFLDTEISALPTDVLIGEYGGGGLTKVTPQAGTKRARTREPIANIDDDDNIYLEYPSSDETETEDVWDEQDVSITRRRRYVDTSGETEPSLDGPGAAGA